MKRAPRFRSGIALIGIISTTFVLAILAGLIPDDPYLRFQILKNTYHASVPWVYERIHFDSRPIDVVLIGPSRTWLGVSPNRMEQDLRQRGMSANVVNFSLPQEGRSENYVVIKELFKTARRPKLLVLGVHEKPPRFGHPAFKYVADTVDVARGAYLINFGYFSDLSYLPFRQMKLAAMRMFPKAFNVSLRFDPASYQGSSYDTTISSQFLPEAFLNRDAVVPRTDLLKQATEWARSQTPPLLPAAAADLEFGDENFYIRKIAKIAASRGVTVAFLYIPYFNGPQKPLEEAFYAQFGPVLEADFISSQDQLYQDFAHLNRTGALVLTDWLSDKVANLLEHDK
jgi:hypothetical protein